MKHPRLWIVNGALVVAIAVVAYFGLTSLFHKAATTAAIRTATVSRGTVEQTETASGNISPAQDENVDFATAGTVSSISVTLGEQVVAGQLLATLDPAAAQTALTAAQGQLAVAESNLALAQAGNETPPQVAQDNETVAIDQQNVSTAQSNLATAQSQLASDQASCDAETTTTTTTTTTVPTSTHGSQTQSGGGASTGSSSTGSSSTGSSSSNPCAAVTADTNTVNQDQTALTNAENSLTQENLSIAARRYVNPATITQDEAAVATAQQSVSNDQQVLSETKLTAPFSGTVIALNGTVGETVSGNAGASAASSTSSSASSAFLTLATLGNLQVVAGFPEADAVKIKVGQPATVTLSALSNTVVSGTVTETDPNPTVVSNVVTYDDTISLTNPPATVQDGMSVTVAVVVASVSNALELPSSAITTTGRLSTVSLLTNGKQTTQSVTVGLVGDSTTQILSGLSAGDVVVEPTVTATAGGGTVTTPRAGGFAGGGFAGAGIARGLG